MPVELITESLIIEPDHVFIIPEKHELKANNCTQPVTTVIFGN
jgi:hypothetical protein